jgi:cysteinyl-tRNA synthetase, unknown class
MDVPDWVPDWVKNSLWFQVNNIPIPDWFENWFDNFFGGPAKQQLARPIKTFGVWLDSPKRIDIACCSYDLVIMDTMNYYVYSKDDIDWMRNGGAKHPENKKKLIAYVSLGEAENYRWYWKKYWKPGKPPFILKENPEWKGNFTVAYETEEWWDITTQILDQAIEAGYDGIFIDKIDAYNDRADAYNDRNADVRLDGFRNELRNDMVKYIKRVKEYVATKNPGMWIIASNAEELGADPEYLKLVDGVVREDFYIETVEEQKNIIKNLNRFKDAGKLVMVIDYVEGEDWIKAKALIEKYGYIAYGNVDQKLNCFPDGEMVGTRK